MERRPHVTLFNVDGHAHLRKNLNNDNVPLGSCNMQRSGIAIVDIGSTDVGAHRYQLQQLLPIAPSRRVARIVVEPHLLSRRGVQRR